MPTIIVKVEQKNTTSQSQLQVTVYMTDQYWCIWASISLRIRQKILNPFIAPILNNFSVTKSIPIQPTMVEELLGKN